MNTGTYPKSFDRGEAHPISPNPSAPGRTTANKRPTGVSILAVLNMIGGVLTIIAAMSIGTTVDDPATASGVAVFLGLFGVLSLAVGIGLWRLRNWARITAMVLYSLSAVAGLVRLAQGDGAGFMQALIAGSIAAYLGRPYARNAFLSQEFNQETEV